jgi:hypothetical protein
LLLFITAGPVKKAVRVGGDLADVVKRVLVHFIAWPEAQFSSKKIGINGAGAKLAGQLLFQR